MQSTDNLSERKKTRFLIQNILRTAESGEPHFYTADPKASRRSNPDAIGLAYNALIEELQQTHKKRNAALNDLMRLIHDLRSPISNARSIIETLLDEIEAGIHEKEHLILALKAVLASCETMDESISHALPVNPKPRYQMREIRLPQVVAKVLEYSLLALRDRKFRVEILQGDDFHIVSDEHMLQSILHRILEFLYQCRNRVHITKVRIVGRYTDSWSEIVIADNGLGIRNSELAQVFEPESVQPDQTIRNLRNLYDVKCDVERMGGRIELNSISGMGTTVRLQFR